MSSLNLKALGKSQKQENTQEVNIAPNIEPQTNDKKINVQECLKAKMSLGKISSSFQNISTPKVTCKETTTLNSEDNIPSQNHVIDKFQITQELKAEIKAEILKEMQSELQEKHALQASKKMEEENNQPKHVTIADGDTSVSMIKDNESEIFENYTWTQTQNIKEVVLGNTPEKEEQSTQDNSQIPANSKKIPVVKNEDIQKKNIFSKWKINKKQFTGGMVSLWVLSGVAMFVLHGNFSLTANVIEATPAHLAVENNTENNEDRVQNYLTKKYKQEMSN